MRRFFRFFLLNLPLWDDSTAKDDSKDTLTARLFLEMSKLRGGVSTFETSLACFGLPPFPFRGCRGGIISEVTFGPGRASRCRRDIFCVWSLSCCCLKMSLWLRTSLPDNLFGAGVPPAADFRNVCDDVIVVAVADVFMVVESPL
mmetsp:Transcript_53780/g.64884  ORF Transcript_53780/g.64884 Transcript_53780/m.64884 type:complete len:145 (+) Transcript_53780:1122-1556(+)